MTVKNLHPGLELQKILDKGNITQRDFAAKIDVTLSLLNSILKGNRNITVNIAVSLEAAGYETAIVWMERQINYLISQTKEDEGFQKKTDDISTWKEIEQLVPISYFKKEGILKNDISLDINTIYDIYNVKSIENISQVITKYDFRYFRKSAAFAENKNNVIAWSKLAEYSAKQIKVKAFDKDREQLLIDELKKCFYKNKDTVANAEKILKKYGIIFFTLDRPEKTPVDGKSFMLNDSPAIVLSLKYKRLDNFAFTLLHELGHVFLHFTKAKYQNISFFVNTSNTEKEENEANLYARDHLIDPEIWDNFIFSNFEYDDKVIMEFAEANKVHPGIVRGRICFHFPEYYTKRSKINLINILS